MFRIRLLVFLLPLLGSSVALAQPRARPCPIEFCRPITAGTHQAENLAIGLTYTVPEGWEVWADRYDSLNLGRTLDESRELEYLATALRIRYNVYALNQSCEEGPELSVPIDSANLSTFWRSLPTVESSWPVAVEVGGLSGLRFEITVSPNATMACEWTDGRPVALLMSGLEPGGLQHNLLPNERLRLYILDHADGNIVIEVVHTPDSLLNWLDWMELTGSIIESFVFDVP